MCNATYLYDDDDDIRYIHKYKCITLKLFCLNNTKQTLTI